jgi:DUF1365 family protein
MKNDRARLSASPKAIPDATGLYLGEVSHSRISPKKHSFSYPYFSVWLNLDELESASEQRKEWFARGLSAWYRLSLARFQRKNYLGPKHVALSDYIRQLAGVSDNNSNQVFFLGQLSYAGIYFSPVNFYFVGQENNYHTMVAEVSNTPWGERHHYLVPLANTNSQAVFSQPKNFQVSPFMSSEQTYQWLLDIKRDKINIQIKSVQNGKPMFSAKLNLSKIKLNRFSLTRVFITTGFIVFSTRMKIYLQALKLLLKGVPFIGHQGLSGNERNNN